MRCVNLILSKSVAAVILPRPTLQPRPSMNHDTPRLRRGVFSYWDAKSHLLKMTHWSSGRSTPARLPEHRQKKTDDQPGEEHQHDEEREEFGHLQGSAGDRRAALGIGDVKAVPGDEESEAWNEEQEQPSQDKAKYRRGRPRADRGVTFHERIPSGPDVRAVQCRWAREAEHAPSRCLCGRCTGYFFERVEDNTSCSTGGPTRDRAWVIFHARINRQS